MIDLWESLMRLKTVWVSQRFLKCNICSLLPKDIRYNWDNMKQHFKRVHQSDFTQFKQELKEALEKEEK